MVEAYIFWSISNIMALIFIFVILFTLKRGSSHNKQWKEILKILFKRLGIVTIIYIILYIIGGILAKSI